MCECRPATLYKTKTKKKWPLGPADYTVSHTRGKMVKVRRAKILDILLSVKFYSPSAPAALSKYSLTIAACSRRRSHAFVAREGLGTLAQEPGPP